MLTRLRHTIGGVRFPVGYDAELATYYLKAAPPGTPVDPDDPDEGLITPPRRGPRRPSEHHRAHRNAQHPPRRTAGRAPTGGSSKRPTDRP